MPFRLLPTAVVVVFTSRLSKWVHFIVLRRILVPFLELKRKQALWNSNLKKYFVGYCQKCDEDEDENAAYFWGIPLFMFQWCSLCKYYFINSKTNKQSAVFHVSTGEAYERHSVKHQHMFPHHSHASESSSKYTFLICCDDPVVALNSCAILKELKNLTRTHNSLKTFSSVIN